MKERDETKEHIVHSNVNLILIFEPCVLGI